MDSVSAESIPDAIDFSDYSKSQGPRGGGAPPVISGIALSGVFFFNPLDASKRDAALNEWDMMD